MAALLTYSFLPHTEIVDISALFVQGKQFSPDLTTCLHYSPILPKNGIPTETIYPRTMFPRKAIKNIFGFAQHVDIVGKLQYSLELLWDAAAQSVLKRKYQGVLLGAYEI